MRYGVLLVTATLLGGTAGAVNARAEAIVQFLDETTAVSVSTMAAPMIFSREQAGLAANARDYVYVGPIEINRTGERRYYLWIGVWSTIDRGAAGQAPLQDAYEKVLITANDRPLELEVLSNDPEALGISKSPYPRPGPGTRSLYSRVTVEQLRTMHEAEYLYVSLGDSNSESSLYRVWKYDKKALGDFVEYARGDVPAD